jgi:multisubunit Na+/H+ antiporter MnhB subunit
MKNILFKKANIIILFLICLVFTLFQLNNFFFWDNIIQVSVPANWYFENNFKYFFLPDDISTGHPTFAGLYLAIAWKVFGKSLAVSHLAFFPFVFGVVYQAYCLISKIEKRKFIVFVILSFVVLDPTLISQLSLVTFDIMQIFFFLLSVNCILKNNKILLSFSFLGLCLTSLRGTVCGAGVILFAIIYILNTKRKLDLKLLLSFLPGIFGIAIFLLIFYLNKHWMIHNTVSNNWGESSAHASFPEMIRNIGIVAWRLIDFGRVGIWIVFCYIFYKILRNRSMFDDGFKIVFFIALSQVAVFLPITMLYEYPFAHRYLMPVMIPATIAIIYWLFKYSRYNIIISIALFVCLISGYFWIYPEKIAKGWDSTPAHWPYYKMRNEMLAYLKSQSIPIDHVASSFPNLSTLDAIDLSGGKIKFKDIELNKDTFILYSNVFNESDEVINELNNSLNWDTVKRIEKQGVFMTLFKRKLKPIINKNGQSVK